MAEIQKIYRGMQNGAETIDENFSALTENIENSDAKTVHIVGDETIAGKKTFTDEATFSKVKSSDDAKVSTFNAIGAPTAKVSYMKKNGVVYVTGAGNWGNFGTANENVKKGTFPTGFRPPVDWHAGMASQGGKSFMTTFITTGGDLMINSAETGEKYGSFSMSYPAEN
jgi:hypothetical protein